LKHTKFAACKWQSLTSFGTVEIVSNTTMGNPQPNMVQRLYDNGVKTLRYSPAVCENKQITWIYRRHTNFSMESIEQTFNGSADFGKKVNQAFKSDA
jgi:hypothetical protein